MRYPASFGQQRQWFLEQLTPGEPTYNMPYAMWLNGPLDSLALQRAIDATVARQAVLRTRITSLDGVPEQVVADAGALPIEHIGLPAGLDEDQRTLRAETIATELAGRPFDLATGPLIRAALIEAGPDRHLFVLIVHHIICDGESMKVLLEEISAFYRAEVTGVPASPPPIWMEYGDYAVWQQDLLRGEELERLLGFWQRQLDGVPQMLSLPTDHPRPTRLSSAGALAKFVVDAATSRRLAELAHRHNATVLMVFLTGFVAVLSRYTRQTEMLIATQAAGRTHTELDPLVGMFTNTLALRMSVAGEPSFTELLCRVRDTTLDALANQQLPFDKLVAEFARERSLAHGPIVQTQFLYGSLTPPILDLPGITATSSVIHHGTAKCDFTVYADSLDGQATTLTMEYSSDLFGPAWAERFLCCIANLLAHAVEAPDASVAELPMLSDVQTQALIAGRNRQTLPADDGSWDIRPLLQASASRVLHDDTTVPLSEVIELAARIARTLADRGVGVGVPVGLCVERGIGMLTALHAIWWAGGAYVPMDPRLPQARLATMAHRAGLRIIISDAVQGELARSIADGIEVIDVDDPAIAAAAPLAPVPMPATALAYVIFTPGSNGQPKGVGVPHGALSNLVTSFQHTLKLGADDRFISVTPLSSGMSVLDLWLPLFSGVDLVIGSADDAREPDRLRSLIERTAATVMQGRPQTWRRLDAAGGVPDCLRVRVCGGEVLPPDVAQRLMTPGATLWNLYGPTETTGWSAARVVTNAATASDIGPSIEHTRMYILDERMMPVPVGVVGELHIAGQSVARGYHGQPRLTARAFRPDPWSSEPGARMYRTGDLGRWREDEGIELVGRNDHQVKIGGFRIECGEIETVLRAHPDVRQAVVVTADRAGEPVLVAYIVPRRGSKAAQPGTDLIEELRPHLRAALPEYMIPSLVVALRALPLTPNARVDRAALPEPPWGASSSTAGHVEPRNPVEVTLARIWGDLLAADAPIGVHNNLFGLGGHSLTATRFVARVEDTYSVALPVREVFANPTIAKLAEIISAHPDFQTDSGSTLDSLSDEELDKLLRAVIAERNRRQARSE